MFHQKWQLARAQHAFRTSSSFDTWSNTLQAPQGPQRACFSICFFAFNLLLPFSQPFWGTPCCTAAVELPPKPWLSVRTVLLPANYSAAAKETATVCNSIYNCLALIYTLQYLTWIAQNWAYVCECVYVCISVWHIKLNFWDVIGIFDSYPAQCQLCFVARVFSHTESFLSYATAGWLF